MAKYDLNTIRSCIFGLAVADALGVPVEFRSREELDRDPVTGMRGYGTYHMPAGSWSDDTSMTLCALAALSLDELEPDSYCADWDAIMKNFEGWLHNGEYTPTGFTFDAGGTCVRAIEKYCSGVEAELCGMRGEYDNGNGSLMRIIPFVLCAPDHIDFIEKGSALTHAHRRCTMACGIYACILAAILDEKDKSAYLDGLERAQDFYGAQDEWVNFKPLFDIESRKRSSIRSSGYVVDTLEAALWCLATTDSYRDCVLKAVNLGGDTDTVAAVAGGLAGALYGMQSIPQAWLNKLLRRDYIEGLCWNAANPGWICCDYDTGLDFDEEDEL